MSHAVSPLAPASFPDLPPIAGVSIATFAAGLRYQKRADLMLALLDEGTTVAGTLTRSLCPSAPVDWCRSILPAGKARAIVCNAGNANAFTGAAGQTAASHTATTIAAALGVPVDEVFLASTGVIGETLEPASLDAGLAALAAELDNDAGATWEEAARAISTTDTYPKGAAASANVGGVDVAISGIAKGSGMIAPDMATMLSFVFTDAAITADALQALVSGSVDASYNAITVDSDTSTSDTVLVFATGAAGNERITDPASADARVLKAALDAVNLDLAHQIVRDGEGASKFIEITVEGAETPTAAHRIGMSIANSPLVKTAIGAADANWGRVVMAVGKAGERADRDRLSIWIGDEQCAEAGWEKPGYSEDRATEHLQSDDVTIRVDVGIGSASATVWTCDLTHAYIDINASYRS